MDEYNVRAVPWQGGWELHIDGVGVTQVDDRDEQLAFRQAKDYIEADRGEPLTPPYTINVTWGRPPLPIQEFYQLFVGDRCFRCPEKGVARVLVTDFEQTRLSGEPDCVELLCRDCLREWMRSTRKKPRPLALVKPNSTLEEVCRPCAEKEKFA